MKTNSINTMRNLFKALLLALTLMVSVNAYAALFTNWGRATYRDAQKVEGQAIAWEFLNDQKIYAKIRYIGVYEEIDEDGAKALCDEPENRYGKRLFDIDPALCKDPELMKNLSVFAFTPHANASKWNYYLLIDSTNKKELYNRSIVEIQMGSTITRAPPKILRVMEKTDTCKDDGSSLLPESNVKIICNGWTWESLDQFWGKDVPPELKALNGTGAPKQVEVLPAVATEPSGPTVVTNPR
jgi:hypothetical protein